MPHAEQLCVVIMSVFLPPDVHTANGSVQGSPANALISPKFVTTNSIVPMALTKVRLFRKQSNAI